jgi:hypothetical protein
VGLNSLKSLNLTNGYPNKNKNNNKNKNKNNKVKSKPLELRSRVTRLKRLVLWSHDTHHGMVALLESITNNTFLGKSRRYFRNRCD